MWTVEALTTVEQATPLREAWDSLARRSALFRPVLSPDWFACCMEAYGSGASGLILVVREDERVRAIAPLWVRPLKFRRLRLRAVEFIHGPDTPFVDLLVDGDCREHAIELLLRHLSREERGWDLCHLSRWPADSPNFRASRAILEREGRRFVVGTSAVLPFLRVRGSWHDFLGRQSAKYRKTRRNIRNRVEKLGAIEVERHDGDPDGRVLADIVQVSRNSWKHDESVGIASRPETLAFFRAWTAAAGRDGWLTIWLLKKDGEPIAMEYGVQDEGQVVAMRADFDKRYKEHSPGAYLQQLILQQLFDAGCREYNTGPGVGPYKERITDGRAENIVLNWFNATALGRLAATLEISVAGRLRRLRQAPILSNIA